jgi:hypothetical protein
MPIARGLKGGGGAYGGLDLRICVFDCHAAARECIRVEEIMKQLGLGIIVAIGLTLPALADPPFLQGTYSFAATGVCLLRIWSAI